MNIFRGKARGHPRPGAQDFSFMKRPYSGAKTVEATVLVFPQRNQELRYYHERITRLSASRC
jgi:hypothetical protein